MMRAILQAASVVVAGVLTASLAVAEPAATTRRAQLPAEFEEVEGVAAVVGETLIPLSELRRAMGSQTAAQDMVPTDIERPRSEEALRRQVLQTLIDNALVLRAAKELGVSVEDREVDNQVGEVKKRNSWDDDDLGNAVKKLGFSSVVAYRAHVRNELTRVRMLQIKLGSRLRIADDEVKKVLELEHCGGTCEEEIHARHIMVAVRGDDPPSTVTKKREKAWMIHDLLASGKKTFEELADQFNDDRGAVDGDLGWQRRWTIEPSLAAKLWSLKKGEFSGAVQTPYGFHVLQLLDRRKSPAKDKDMLDEIVRRRLQEDQLGRLYKAWIEELRRITHIEVRV